MSEIKRVRSIARRFGRSWQWRLLTTFLRLNLLAVLLAVGAFCFLAEEQSEAGFTPFRGRSFLIEESQPLYRRYDGAVYRFEGEDGEWISRETGDYFVLLRYFLTGLCGIELLLLLGQARSGARTAQRLLRPLREMAESAQQLSQARFDERKYHDLESAIDNISPAHSDAQLHTGDRELAGLENAVNSLLRRMRESYRQQTRFVSDASHELRTPIAVIQGYADMLDRWGKEDRRVLEEGISAIRAETAHMSKLVEQLLFLARGDSGRQRLNIQPVSLKALLSEVYEEYRMIDAGHRFVLKAEEVFCEGDADMLKQAARILVDNAVKYSQEGSAITLWVKNDEGPAFAVQDEGIGMNGDDLPHAFERFYRSDPARSRESGGTGLGLSIAKWIVDAHEGYVRVLSCEGVGTRMTVVLPEKKSA